MEKNSASRRPSGTDWLVFVLVRISLFCIGHDVHTSTKERVKTIFPDSRFKEETSTNDKCVQCLKRCSASSWSRFLHTYSIVRTAGIRRSSTNRKPTTLILIQQQGKHWIVWYRSPTLTKRRAKRSREVFKWIEICLFRQRQKHSKWIKNWLVR